MRRDEMKMRRDEPESYKRARITAFLMLEPGRPHRHVGSMGFTSYVGTGESTS